MLSKSYMRSIAQIYSDHLEVKQKIDSSSVKTEKYEHIGVGKYRIPKCECNAPIGTSINVTFMHRFMRSKGSYITEKFNVFMQDNEYTYISIY